MSNLPAHLQVNLPQQTDIADLVSSEYLPRLQQMTSNSDKCKSGEFPINHYAFIAGENYEDLGKQLDVLFLAWQPLAMDTSSGSPLYFYNQNSPNFLKTQQKSGVQDSGCMYGPNFLVWIPQLQKFATFFAGTKSLRRDAAAFDSFLKQGAFCTLEMTQRKTPKYTWFSTAASKCNASYDMPPADEATAKAIKMFQDAKDSEVELADQKESGDRER